jgi:hypothetical protein
MYNGVKAKIPLGERGLLTDIAPDKVPPDALIRANNIIFSNGNIQKAPGTRKWNDIPLTAGIVAVHHWRPSTIRDRYIAVTSNGSIYRGQDRVFPDPINESISSVLTPNCIFSEGGAETAGREKKLFLFTGGVTNPYVLNGDGTAFTTFASPNEDWTASVAYPTCGVVHRNSLWAFSGQRSYASSTGDHENFSNASAAYVDPVYPGEGGDIKGAYVFKSRLFCFKDSGFVYMLNDLDSTSANWYWEKAGSNFGLAAPNAIAEVLNDMFAGNDNGTLNSYMATEKLGNVEAGDIVQELQFESYLRGNTSKIGVPYQHVHFYSEKKLLFQTYRSHYTTANDMLIVYDFGRKGTIRPSFWKKGTPQCLASYRDNNGILRPMYGDASGYLHLMDFEDRVEGQAEVQIPAVQRITTTPDLTSGTYVLNWGGYGTTTLNWDAASQPDIENALNLLPDFGDCAVNGALSGIPPTGLINITFDVNGPAELITVTENTTGATFTVTTITTGVPGSPDAAVAYTGDFQIPHLDFSHLDPALSSVEKHFDFLAVHYAPEGDFDLSCDYFIDGRFIETITFNMQQYVRPQLGTLLLGTDRLAQANTETSIRTIAGTGRTFSARFYNAGTNESFQVSAITVMFRPGGNRAQQV